MKRPTLPIAIMVTIAAALTGLVTCAAVVGTPPRSDATDRSSPLGVAETLDSIVQPRFYTFQDMRFGMSRIAVQRKVPGHPTHFDPENAREKPLFASIDASRRDYMILFYRSAAPPPTAAPYLSSPEAEFRYIHGTPSAMSAAFYPVEIPAFDIRKAEWLSLVRKELPRLKKGEKVNHEVGDWLLAMRPVKNNEKCISCHVDSRPEDMLGIMVYAVDKTARRKVAAVAPSAVPVVRTVIQQRQQP